VLVLSVGTLVRRFPGMELVEGPVFEPNHPTMRPMSKLVVALN
jgi:hypothetical protein